jgi:ShK domain-like
MKLLFQLFFIAFLDCLYLGDVRGESTCSIEGDCPNQEAEEECVDLHENCEGWAESDECEENPDYMLLYCRKACQRCNDKPRAEDYGVPQATEGSNEVEILSALEDMEAYFHKIRNDPSTSHKMHELFDNCKLKHENCAFWKVLGECENVGTVQCHDVVAS